MDILGRFGSKLRETNATLATAHKSWRDERLDKREQSNLEKEKGLSEREAQIADQLRELRRLEGQRARRRAGTIAALLLSGVLCFFVGLSVGSSSANGSAQSGEANQSHAASTSTALKPNEELGTIIPVGSDPDARYIDEGSGQLANGNLWSTTRREGSSGTSFSKREIDCSAQTFRYLGEGATLATINDSADAVLGPLKAGSISTIISDYTCSKHGHGSVSGG